MVYYVIDDDIKTFDKEIDLLKFIKSKFDKVQIKSDVWNILKQGNYIELHLVKYFDILDIGILGNTNKENIVNLWIDIGKYLGCFSKEI